MWQGIIKFCFDFLKSLSSICDWLFEPIDIAEKMPWLKFGGLLGGTIGQALADLKLEVAPVEVISLTGITAIIVLGMIKLFSPLS